MIHKGVLASVSEQQFQLRWIGSAEIQMWFASRMIPRKRAWAAIFTPIAAAWVFT